MKRLFWILLVLCAGGYAAAQETYQYALKDTSVLYLDIHRPTPGAQTTLDSVEKPTILYVFGGGFVVGARNEDYILPWFKTLNDNGYTVVSIDYRLGMKGYKMGKGLSGLARSVPSFYTAQQMGVEDVFSAISYLEQHPELGIDIHNIVIAGSSAGAIISLASVYALTNNVPCGQPEGFMFKGAISFSGAIISQHGAPIFATTPCPILFFHGMDDKAVAYRHFSAFGKGMWGSSFFADKMRKKGGIYHIRRFQGHGHDVAAYMNLLWTEEQVFLEQNVIKQNPLIIDATVNNPALPVWEEWGQITTEQMYNGGLNPDAL